VPSAGSSFPSGTGETLKHKLNTTTTIHHPKHLYKRKFDYCPKQTSLLTNMKKKGMGTPVSVISKTDIST
jgi:hypothetical protein